MADTPVTEKNKDGYYKGSKDIAEETPLTLVRLEPRRQLTKNSDRLVIALVGLPARGKSFVARKLEAHLNWSGNLCKIFNVGRYRRQAYAEMMKKEAEKTGASKRQLEGACDASFFDANNEMASQIREQVAEMAMLDMLRWLDDMDDETEYDDHSHSENTSRHSSVSLTGPGGAKLDLEQKGRIAIFDATNSTNKRRQWILHMCTSPERRRGKRTGVVFLESICNDQELLNENYLHKVSNSPDFQGMTLEEALVDLKDRVRKYEEQYETIDDDSLSYMKVYNLSTKLLCNHVYGRMAKDLVPALMAWHIGSRPIFLCRPGETLVGIYTDGEDYVAKNRVNPSDPRFIDLSGKSRRRGLRGDPLGPQGEKFRKELLNFCYDEVQSFLLKRASVRDMSHTGTSVSGLATSASLYRVDSDPDIEGHNSRDPFPMRILTSTMPRAVDTVDWSEYEFQINQMSSLNPLDKGDFAGMELDELRLTAPEWFARLEHDPFGTRFPGGECYRDLVRRLTSIVIDLEQQVIPTLVVSHVSILQCLMAYFRNIPVQNCMSIAVPMHTVIKYTPVRGAGWIESFHPLLLEETSELPSAIIHGDSPGNVSQLSVQEHDPVPFWTDAHPRINIESVSES